MMEADERKGFLNLLEEMQRAIESGEQKTRETQRLLDDLGQRIDIAHDEIVPCAQELISNATPIAVQGRWYRSSPLQFLKTPLGTKSSRLHPARYNRRLDVGGAIYITNDAKTAVAERKASVCEEAYYGFPVDISLQRILDLSSKEACQAVAVSYDLIRIEWQFIHDILGKVPYTHHLGDIAMDNLFEGILFESVRLPGTLNLVVFPSVMKIGSFVKVHDPREVFLQQHRCCLEDLAISGIVPEAENNR